MIKKRVVSLDISHESYPMMIEKIVDLSIKKMSSYVCISNVHMTIEAYQNKLFSEVVNNADIATPDPSTVRFISKEDPIRGSVWIPGQWQNGKFVSFQDDITVQYVPLDPLPDVPYGRSILTPAIFSAMFLIGLLQDIIYLNRLFPILPSSRV